METKNNIINRHLYIDNEYDLVDYLYDQFEKNGFIYNIDIEVEPVESDDQRRISGYLNNIYVEIIFNFQRSMILRTNAPGRDEEKLLVKTLNPIMWNVDKNSKSPKLKSGDREVIFTAPIFEVYYSSYGMHEIMWNTYDPERSLYDLAFILYVMKENVDDVKIYHPSYDIKKIGKKLKVGNYPAGLKPEFVESLQTKSELEMYLLIVATRKEILNIYDQYTQEENPVFENQVLMKNYQLQYLIQQAGKMFNIKVNPPAKDLVEPTAEILAWEKWWGNAVQNVVLTQDGFMQIANGKFGYNTDFRPKGSYKEFIPECEKLLNNMKNNAPDQKEKS